MPRKAWPEWQMTHSECLGSASLALPRQSPSRPFHERRHGREDGIDIAAGLQPEDRAAVVEKVELDVTAAPHELRVALGLGPGRCKIAPHDLRIDRKKAFADVAHKGELGIEARRC